MIEQLQAPRQAPEEDSRRKEGDVTRRSDGVPNKRMRRHIEIAIALVITALAVYLTRP